MLVKELSYKYDDEPLKGWDHLSIEIYLADLCYQSIVYYHNLFWELWYKLSTYFGDELEHKFCSGISYDPAFVLLVLAHSSVLFFCHNLWRTSSLAISACWYSTGWILVSVEDRFGGRLVQALATLRNLLIIGADRCNQTLLFPRGNTNSNYYISIVEVVS